MKVSASAVYYAHALLSKVHADHLDDSLNAQIADKATMVEEELQSRKISPAIEYAAGQILHGLLSHAYLHLLDGPAIKNLVDKAISLGRLFPEDTSAE